ncbi:transcriptional repressor [Thalassomonas viridans]|uniref:Transcriptional repressor n=1 Tax=Thalassomonas viridans TaxID=137584 RepID=A0AAE9Z1H4_9GAMM|nr:transcriptional repressor [Thalassomonas viridans]WDE05091.1 transcriptional repressor [Thalassomonas viridans]
MEQVQTYLLQAEKQCQQHGSRLTAQRKRVLSLLLQAEKALSAYELLDLFEIHFKQPLAPMSIYRTLEFLESVHLAHKLNIANKYVACAHIGCGHSHTLSQFLFCQQCQRVDETSLDSSMRAELAGTMKQTGYRLLSPQIELSCICNACQLQDDADNSTAHIQN